MLPIYDELHCTPPILSVDGLSIGVAGERAFFEFGDRAAHSMAFPAEIIPTWSRLYCVFLHPLGTQTVWQVVIASPSCHVYTCD